MFVSQTFYFIDKSYLRTSKTLLQTFYEFLYKVSLFWTCFVQENIIHGSLATFNIFKILTKKYCKGEHLYLASIRSLVKFYPIESQLNFQWWKHFISLSNSQYWTRELGWKKLLRTLLTLVNRILSTLLH